MSNAARIQADGIVAELVRLLGPAFPLDLLVERVSLWRDGHPIKIEEDSMPVGMTGYTVPLRDCDLICVRPGLDYIRRVSVLLHELAHILLGHVPLKKDDHETRLYKDFIRNRDMSVIYCRRQKGAIDVLIPIDPAAEKQTEMLAALLVERITNGESLSAALFDYERKL